ncbi:hypothetical protein [Oryza sativa Japonica Group]|uniref:Uncharacterized protein n=1 Tax=Oryza sativa subsp. japonica TaxID=39947 RepID=Q5VNT4_ORYSJ|nr:hypothetical protein [Oryza sativa Japonica Group]
MAAGSAHSVESSHATVGKKRWCGSPSPTLPPWLHHSVVGHSLWGHYQQGRQWGRRRGGGSPSQYNCRFIGRGTWGSTGKEDDGSRRRSPPVRGLGLALPSIFHRRRGLHLPSLGIKLAIVTGLATPSSKKLSPCSRRRA